MSKPRHCPGCDDGCQYLGEIGELREKVNELSEQVLTDALTGLYNYRHLIWAMNQEIERVHRSGGAFSVIMLDFDNFKTLNDRYGHEFGNQVLKAAGTFFQRSLRKLDIPCRFGGEEFVLVLPSTELRDAIALAERIREGVARMQMQADGQRVPLSISMGVDVYRASDRISPDVFLDRADQYLLQAKQSGKNRVHYPQMADAADGMSADERSALMDGFDRDRSA
ncbi:MAG: GGDEF domain-containing protein [Gammaproteobacteria bacterium]|nr:GGDEF domain-containing protein [Gammaproteobacteria bacterium]|tara:strand:- start:825 stop:1496 length:672 start_codon:yes stop_codon:yes gene_type:complete